MGSSCLDQVNPLDERKISFPTRNESEKGMLWLYRYVHPHDDRVVKLQLDAWMPACMTAKLASLSFRGGKEGKKENPGKPD